MSSMATGEGTAPHVARPVIAAPPLTVLHTVRSLAVNGITSVVLRNVAELARRNIKSVVCYMHDDHSMAHAFRDVGIEAVSVGHEGPATALRSVRRIRELIARHGVNVVHTNQTIDLMLAGVAARSTGLPVVATIHWLAERDSEALGAGSMVASRTRQQLRNLADRSLADRIIAVSAAVRDTHAEMFGSAFPSSKVEVLFPGISMSDVPNAAQRDEDRRRIRGELGLSNDDIVLLNIGRLHPVKGQRLLMPMMNQLRTELPNATLLIAGDGPLRAELEASIVEHGLQRHIRMLGARLDVPELLRASDALVLASESEAAPLPLMEAMRESRPVVATAVGGVPEMVDDGISGFVVPRARPDEMAAAVVQMFTPPERAIEMGTAGRRVALERFDIPRIAERLEQLYREVSRDR